MVEETVEVSPDTMDPENQEKSENLVSQLEEAKRQAAEHWDRFVRKEAELQNYRKRADQQMAEIRRYAIHDFATQLLAVMDSIESGLNTAEKNTRDTVLYEGLKLTHQIISDLLAKYNISPIDPIGEPFKPGEHEALTMQPATEEIPHNHVMVVVQKGYQLSDRVLRPAKVVVAQDKKEL